MDLRTSGTSSEAWAVNLRSPCQKLSQPFKKATAQFTAFELRKDNLEGGSVFNLKLSC